MSGVDLLNVRRALDAMAAERTRLETEIQSLLQQREDIASAPLCLSDVETVLLNSIRSEPPGSLVRVVEMIRSRPHKVWATTPPIWANDGSELGTLLACLLNAEIRKGIGKALKALPEPENVGLPLAQRAEKIGALDVRIEKAERALGELRESAVQAGLSWPERGLYA